MRIYRSFIIVFAAGCVFALAATSSAQEKPSKDEQEQVKLPVDIEKEFNIPFWTELLDLKKHQVKSLELIQSEMKERLQSEVQEFGGDPEFVKQLTQDLLTESRERIRETLNGNQLVKFEKYMAKEKQRRAELEHPEDEAASDDKPHDKE